MVTTRSKAWMKKHLGPESTGVATLRVGLGFTVAGASLASYLRLGKGTEQFLSGGRRGLTSWFVSSGRTDLNPDHPRP